MVLGLRALMEYYDDGMLSQGELLEALAETINEANLDKAAAWLAHHPAIELPNTFSRVWFLSSGQRIVLTQRQVHLMRLLVNKSRALAS